MQKRESRKDLLSRFQDSKIDIVFLRDDKIVFRTRADTEKKFWERLFGTETFTIKEMKANFIGIPTIELTLEPLADAVIDYIEVQFREKNRTWFLSKVPGKMMPLEFRAGDTITLNILLEDVWDGR